MWVCMLSRSLSCISCICSKGLTTDLFKVTPNSTAECFIGVNSYFSCNRFSSDLNIFYEDVVVSV